MTNLNMNYSPILSEFSRYLSSPETIIAVEFPAILSLWFLIRAAQLRTFPAWLALGYVLCLPVMYVTSRWQLTEYSQSLFILPLVTIFCVAAAWKRHAIHPTLGFALVFCSGWVIDMVCAIDLLHVPNGESQAISFYQGVGGAGAGDGLLICPFLTYFALTYAYWRQAGKQSGVLRDAYTNHLN